MNVGKDDILRGQGSKQITLTSSVSGSYDPVIKVESNHGDWAKTAIIENLIIDKTSGTQQKGVGILLEDVYNCIIRNVTIKNCNVGIRIRATSGKWAESNNISCVRMMDVKRGIWFDKGYGTGSFGFTNISNVGISLYNATNLSGIYIGSGCKPYASVIKATVWMTTSSYGMVLYGELKYGLINLAVEKLEGSSAGTGVYLGSQGEASCNQSFFLATGNIATPIENNYARPCDIQQGKNTFSSTVCSTY